MKNRFIYMLSVFLISFISLNADQLEDIQKAGVLNVGIEKEFAPFNFINRQGERVGFDIDIIEYIAKEMGVKLKYTILPFSDLMPSVEDKSIDVAIAAIMHKQKRETNVDFSITYMYDGQSIMSKKDSSYENYKSFNGKNIGAILGHSSGKVFEAISPLSNVMYFKDLEELKLALLDNVIDAVTSDETALAYLVNKDKDKLKMIGKKFTIQPYGIVLPENQSKLRDTINFSIQKLVKDKTYNKIYKKWFNKEISKRPVLWP